jgi:predicted DNA-binding protein
MKKQVVSRTINIQVPLEVHKRLKEIAKNDLRPMRSYTQKIIADHVERQWAKINPEEIQ